jgi:hypothetical protein
MASGSGFGVVDGLRLPNNFDAAFLFFVTLALGAFAWVELEAEALFGALVRFVL